MNDTIIADIRETLTDNADAKTLAFSDRNFKKGEEAKVYGVKMALVTKIAKESFKLVEHLDKSTIFNLCEELWQSGYLEEAVVACVWAEGLSSRYEQEDFKLFEYWVYNYLNNWADCDTLCNHTVGSFVMKYPDYVKELKRWAVSSKRIVRRAAAVTLIIPARKGLFVNHIFEIADLLLQDKDDLVQKGYGWMLKAASEAHRDKVFEYVMSKKDVMPRTSLRYAIEKMPAEMRAEAMKR